MFLSGNNKVDQSSGELWIQSTHPDNKSPNPIKDLDRSWQETNVSGLSSYSNSKTVRFKT